MIKAYGQWVWDCKGCYEPNIMTTIASTDRIISVTESCRYCQEQNEVILPEQHMMYPELFFGEKYDS